MKPFIQVINQLNEEYLGIVQEKYISMENTRKEFIKTFPKEHLSLMQLDDYVIGRTNELQNESFCYWLETKLRELGSIKGGSAEKFGVFYSQEKHKYVTTKRWSSSLSPDEAFVNIKEEIRSLLVNGELKNLENIENNSLPTMLKNKILTTYFPNDYINIFSEEHIDFYCFELNIPITPNDTLSIKREKLLHFKNNTPELNGINNYIFMRYLYYWYKPNIRNIRILPMSATLEFTTMTISDLQEHFFHNELIKNNGIYHFRSKSMSTTDYTYVLFQFKNSIVASARLLSKEKYDLPKDSYAGHYIFDINTIKTFEPITSDEIKHLDNNFKGFSQATINLSTKIQAKLLDLIASKQQYIIPDEIINPSKITEGAKKQIIVNAYERSSKARTLCIQKHGYQCAICGFDFGKFYGTQFEGKIHIHHKVPLHEIGQEYDIDSAHDLIPVCPNCHMILHAKSNGGYYSVEEVKDFIHTTKNK
ncbi:MAG: HNH endonuclease [Eubacteriales bacterium]